MKILLFLSFFLSKTKVSGFCARCFSVVVVVVVVLLRTETAEKLKKNLQKNKKEEKNYLKHRAQTFYNTAVMSNNKGRRKTKR